jgi:hypothetical protein
LSNSIHHFIPGLELSRRFFATVVEPILQTHYPNLRYGAGLIGAGSEVLGFDTEMSTDHHWGPRVMLFVGDEEHQLIADQIIETLGRTLPRTFMGYSTHFAPPDPNDNGVRLLADAPEEGPINHRVEVLTLRGYLHDYLALDIEQELTPVDWLIRPEQRLLTFTAGDVFRDEIGLEALRAKFAYYPHDVWLYLMAAGWSRIGQEEHLMGRAGFVGDELGSALIGARLVRDVMRLSFMQERRYAPYPKWLGTAFKRLEGGPILAPTLAAALHAETWQERSARLAEAYRYCAQRHNALGLTDPLPEEPTLFFGRPFPVIWGQSYADALLGAITDPAMQQLVAHAPLGSIDQISDNVNLLEQTEFRLARRAFYD